MGILSDHPVQRMIDAAIYLSIAVTRVIYEPGNCDGPHDTQRPLLKEYVAEVKKYTLYAVPVVRYRIGCGGWTFL